MQTRRQFLQRALLSGASLSLITSCKPGNADNSAFDPGSFDQLKNKIKGNLILPGDNLYEQARWVASHNPSTDKRPYGIIRCASQDDVVRSMEFARKYELTTAVRSGGHSFVGWSSCDDGLVIEVSGLKNISIDPKTQTARVGAGVRAAELVNAAAVHGLAPVMGECGSVGVAGLTLGGGLGWLSGKYGAACDNLLSADLVTVDLQTLDPNGDSNPDLFWAIRGGGGNFGIVTSLEYQLHPVNRVLAGGFTYPMAKARDVLRFYREFMVKAPDDLQALAYLFPSETPVLNVIVVWLGDVKDGEKILKPFQSVFSPLRNTVQLRPYPETLSMPPYGEFPPRKYDSTKGTYVEEMSDEVIDVALAHFNKKPFFGAIGFDHYMHGAVCRVAPDATAFAHRSPGALHVWLGAGWDSPGDTETSMQWAEEGWKAFQPFTGKKIYSNYVGNEIVSSSREVFGASLERLEKIKGKYDPDNFLQLNHNLKPI